MTAQPTGTPPALAHNLRYNKILHADVVVLTATTAQRPHVPPNERLQIKSLGHGIHNVRVEYGFMDDPDIPAALAMAREQGSLEIDLADLTYFVGRETILVTRREGMALWREKLFVLHGAECGAPDGILSSPAGARSRARSARSKCSCSRATGSSPLR